MNSSAALQYALCLVKLAGRGETAFKFLRNIGEFPEVAEQAGAGADWGSPEFQAGLIERGPSGFSKEIPKTPESTPLNNLFAAGLRQIRANRGPRNYAQSVRKFNADQHLQNATHTLMSPVFTEIESQLRAKGIDLSKIKNIKFNAK